MSTSCAEFRGALEAALAGPERRRAALAQDPHVADCAACRTELAREQGLERALAAVPAVAAPPALARRLLARLAPERGTSGDAAARDEIDELLARVPPPRVPAGLAGSVLANLAPERAHPRGQQGWRLGPAWLLAAAAGLVLGWILLVRRAAPDEMRQELARVALALEADEELLAYALERWELLHDEDLDLWLASLDPVDELLMEVAGEELWLDTAADGGAQR